MKKIRRTVLFLFASILLQVSATNHTLYVSTQGDDGAIGSIEKPIRSLQEAVVRVEKHRQKSPTTNIEVLFAEGEYFIADSVCLDKIGRSNTAATVTFAGMGDNVPLFTGSVTITNFYPLSDTKILSRLDEQVGRKVLVADLSSSQMNDFGSAVEIGKRPDLFVDGVPQPLARYPNNGFLRAGKAVGTTALVPGRSGMKEGVFEYTDERIDRWKDETDACLSGYWFWDWSEQYHQVEKIDIAKRQISVAEPYHNYGYKDSLRFFGLNLLSEIDQPGEYYVDRVAKKLYWYPIETFKSGITEVRLSVNTSPYMVKLTDCTNIEFRQLAFTGGRGTAMLIEGGANCRLTDCRIESFGHDGVHIRQGKNHRLSGCILQQFGCAGISVIAGDRKTLTPCDHVIENTVVRYFSNFKRTYQPAIYFSGVGLTVRQCEFAYSPSSAMRIDGNDVLVELCDFHDLVQESDDQGAIDMWYDPSFRGVTIRHNRWRNIVGGTHYGSAAIRFDDMISGIMVFGNVFENCGSVFFGAVQIHGGKDNVIDNNVMYKCEAAVSFTAWGEKQYLRTYNLPMIQEKIFKEVDINSPIYQQRYPELKDILKNADQNIVRNNLLIDCRHEFLREKGANIIENTTLLDSQGKSVEAFLSPDLLAKYKLTTIPFEQIGVKKNRFIQP